MHDAGTPASVAGLSLLLQGQSAWHGQILQLQCLAAKNER
jgi:hypothetical protein